MIQLSQSFSLGVCVLAGEMGWGSCFLGCDILGTLLLQAELVCLSAEGHQLIFSVLSELFSLPTRLPALGWPPHCFVQLHLCQEAPRELHSETGGHGSDPPCAWSSREHWGHAGVGRWGWQGKRPVGSPPFPKGEGGVEKGASRFSHGTWDGEWEFLERCIHLWFLGRQIPPKIFLKESTKAVLSFVFLSQNLRAGGKHRQSTRWHWRA